MRGGGCRTESELTSLMLPWIQRMLQSGFKCQSSEDGRKEDLPGKTGWGMGDKPGHLFFFS